MINPVFVTVAEVALGLAAAAAIYRIAKGPSLLDRMLASDVLLSIVVTALLLDMAVNRNLNNLVLVISLAVVGFIGSVTVARFVQDRSVPDDGTGRRETEDDR
ncbi:MULTISPECIES: monovalent cation/H+ antiporter complex subunit F [Arthrobacter]|uniref:Monovalent cation/H+ antiporter complex subunit F n=2 Tax=Arthrobacter TaxID=1663 RepID=A0ABU9KJE2_9MICC|nr:monovalent cation/H+ antiporter complex subunit F [Arthrobacter sp. YJM1]MDP5226748.1 monovalent cation/H+ antiporter complex subunit F [Arthrobacter sp. YJM1]